MTTQLRSIYTFLYEDYLNLSNIEHVKGMTRIDYLNLYNIEHLKGMTRIDYLNLSNIEHMRAKTRIRISSHQLVIEREDMPLLSPQLRRET